MATEKQIAANRRNARLSTGPRTEEGKAASSKNALTHGLSSRATLIAGEDRADYDALRSDLYAHFLPPNEYARTLVDALCEKVWRLKRVGRLEALLFEVDAHKFKLPFGPTPIEQAKAEFEQSRPELSLMRSLTEYVLPNDALAKLGRHEAHLLREIERLHRLLPMISEPHKRKEQGAAEMRVVEETANTTRKALPTNSRTDDPKPH